MVLEIDVEDETTINAEPATVLKTLVNEAAGRTHWWLPHWEGKPHGDILPDQVGGMFDIIVRRGITVRFTAKVVEITDKKWHVEYIDGAYRGEGIWTFEPVDGKTHLRFQWKVRPMGWLRWLLSLAPSSSRKGTSHHEVMKAGFAGLNRYLDSLQVVEQQYTTQCQG
jgi:hypothetical protein